MLLCWIHAKRNLLLGATSSLQMHKVDWLLILTYMQAVFPLESKSRTYNYILTQNYGCSSMLTVITPKYLDVLDIFIDEMSELKPQLFRIAYPHHSFSGGGRWVRLTNRGDAAYKSWLPDSVPWTAYFLCEFAQELPTGDALSSAVISLWMFSEWMEPFLNLMNCFSTNC